MVGVEEILQQGFLDRVRVRELYAWARWMVGVVGCMIWETWLHIDLID